MDNQDESSLPTVKFHVDTSNLKAMHQAANIMAQFGFSEAVGEADKTISRANALSQRFIQNAGAKEVNEAQKLESSLVGHSKSGYVPTGNLQGSIKPKFSDNGMTVEIRPAATTKGKNGENYYGQYVEFGTYKMAPEPYMKPSGEKVAEQLEQEFDDITRRVNGE